MIGGLTEKLLAAKRNEIKTVLIPKENEIDLKEIPDKVKSGMKLITIERADEAIPYVFPDIKLKAASQEKSKKKKSSKKKAK